MAYDASKETQELLVMLDKNNRGDKIGIKKITRNDNGTISADIRNYYTNDAEEICPTSKGVRVNTEMLADVVTALVDMLEVDEIEQLMEKCSEKLGDD